MELAKKVGLKIKKLRLEKNLSQTELAGKLGGTAKKICGYEKGINLPSVEALQKLSIELCVSSDYFLFDDIKKDAESLKTDREIYNIFLQLISLNNKDKEYAKRLLKGIIVQNKLDSLN